MSYTLQLILLDLVLPPLGPFIVLLIALWLRPHWRKVSLAIALSAVLMQLGASVAGWHTLGTAESTPQPRVSPPYPEAEAIVVLGGGRYLDAPEYGGDTAGPSTLERVRYAAKLHRETGKPILVSGGKPGQVGDVSEAAIMRGILQDEFHVPVRWVEDQSEDTASNALFASQLLKQAGIQRVYLVTHDNHMQRAIEAFRLRGMQPVAMPTHFVQPMPPSATMWLPSLYGLQANRWVLIEWIGRLKLRISGALTADGGPSSDD